jgi:hypothetical protein
VEGALPDSQLAAIRAAIDAGWPAWSEAKRHALRAIVDATIG